MNNEKFNETIRLKECFHTINRLKRIIYFLLSLVRLKNKYDKISRINMLRGDIMMYHKFKDKKPLETIEAARKALSKWGVFVTETWFDSIQGLYSVVLRVDGTDFFSCGKGTDRLYTLASAYGEMMEDMQNLVFFRLKGRSLLKDNCEYDDDSIVEKQNDDTIYSNLSYWMNCVQGHVDDKILEKMQEFSYSLGEYIRYEKFRNIQNNEVIDLPVCIVDHYYGSNGMVAGNTQAEAYVQGLSEILERFVIKEILEKSITPPTITTEIKNSMPDVINWINEIEERGEYRVELKDFSLGRKIPAIGLILYNRNNMSYFVKAAAHPSIEIAVERCFTELMQGKKIEDFKGMIRGSDFFKGYGDINNFIKIFSDGSGRYPSTLFVGKPSYKGSFQKKSYVDNQEMLLGLTSLIDDLGYSIFVRDVTKSKIFAYRILVPGMSELFNVMDPLVIQNCIDYKKFSNIIQYRLHDISTDEAFFVLEFLKKKKYSENLTLDVFIDDIKLTDDNVYSIVPIKLFICLLYIKVNDIENALLWMRKYNEMLDSSDPRSSYYYCYELYLALKSEYEDKQLISQLLAYYFDEEIVDEVMLDVDKNPFEYFYPLNCDNDCLNCEHSTICTSKNENRIYNLIRKHS